MLSLNKTNLKTKEQQIWQYYKRWLFKKKNILKFLLLSNFFFYIRIISIINCFVSKKKKMKKKKWCHDTLWNPYPADGLKVTSSKLTSSTNCGPPWASCPQITICSNVTLAWTAMDGVEAVAKCAADRPDLILMDLIGLVKMEPLI